MVIVDLRHFRGHFSLHDIWYRYLSGGFFRGRVGIALAIYQGGLFTAWVRVARDYVPGCLPHGCGQVHTDSSLGSARGIMAHAYCSGVLSVRDDAQTFACAFSCADVFGIHDAEFVLTEIAARGE